MPFYVPAYGEFATVVDSQASVRPAANFGASIVPGNNTYSAHTSVLVSGASLDSYGIFININSLGVNTAASDTLCTIGVDPAGGTAYVDWITDLVCGGASPYNAPNGGCWYFFPIFLKAGTSISAKLSQNNASPTTGRVFVRLLCQPREASLVKVGAKVVTYGAVTATSSGTAITPGGASEGAYTQLGTIAAGDNPFFWQCGLGLNNAAVSTGGVYHVDLAVGQAAAKKTPILDSVVSLNTSEQQSWGPQMQGWGLGASGELVYGRAQYSGTVQTGVSMAAYGVC